MTIATTTTTTTTMMKVEQKYEELASGIKHMCHVLKSKTRVDGNDENELENHEERISVEVC
jgi:hypothetical protein